MHILEVAGAGLTEDFSGFPHLLGRFYFFSWNFKVMKNHFES